MEGVERKGLNEGRHWLELQIYDQIDHCLLFSLLLVPKVLNLNFGVDYDVFSS